MRLWFCTHHVSFWWKSMAVVGEKPKENLFIISHLIQNGHFPYPRNEKTYGYALQWDRNCEYNNLVQVDWAAVTYLEVGGRDHGLGQERFPLKVGGPTCIQPWVRGFFWYNKIYICKLYTILQFLSLMNNKKKYGQSESDYLETYGSNRLLKCGSE